MINNYIGEFTAIPFALELSGLNCSNACSYCFANYTNMNRTLDIRSIANQIINAQHSKSNSILKYLLNNRYVVMMSNRSDPFSFNNYKFTLNIIELLRKFDFPISYQTKGKYGINEVLEAKKIEHWYISIPYFDDNKRLLYEPQAPTIKERLEIIELLKANKQDVNVGINPLNYEFISLNEVKLLCEELKKLGVKNIALNNLHFSNIVRQNMKNQNLINLLRKKDIEIKYTFQVAKQIKDCGLDPFFIGYPMESKYFDEVNKIYGYNKLLPIFQDFINMLYQNNKNSVTIEFNDLFEFYNDKLLNIEFNNTFAYMFQPFKGYWIKNKLQRQQFKTLKDVLLFFWNANINKGLLRYDCFEEYSEKDSHGNSVLVFNPLTFNDYEKCFN